MRATSTMPGFMALASFTLLALVACGGGEPSMSESRDQRMSVSSTPLTSIPDYTVTNIGLGGGGGWVSQKGINASGQVAGNTSLPDGTYHAFFFDGNSTTDLGTLGGDYSYANALNDSGQVTGFAYTARNTTYRAFSWKSGGSLIDITPASYSVGYAINNAGLIVGYAEDGGSGGFAWSETGGYQRLGSGSYFVPFRVNGSGQMVGTACNAMYSKCGGAIRQTDGTVTSVDSSANYEYGSAQLINDDAVVGGYVFGTRSSFSIRAYSWRGGTLELFDALAPAGSEHYSYVHDLNQFGQMVGYGGRFVDPTLGWEQTGFVRSPTGLTADIGNLGAAGSDSYAIPYAINNHGQVVGYSGSNSVQPRAFTWTPATGIVDLNTKLSNPPPGLVLSQALAISDNGSIVASTDTGGLVLLKPAVSGPPPTAPALGPITANDPVSVGSTVNVGVTFTDVNTSDTHAAQWAWGDASANTAGGVTESNGAGSASGSHVFTAAGVYKVSVAVTDRSGRTATVGRDVVVYDPSAGFVTGGGWINSPMGAYKADTTLAGRAAFGFVSKYKRGATVPTGETEFQFQAAKLNFHSNTYDWLVVAGARAQYKGIGTLNGKAGYKFMLTAVDGALLAKGTPDRFRIKIWHFDADQNADVLDYDNQIDASLEGGNTEGTAIGGGSIVIHK